MSKDPTPRADALRAQREARYGHLQAHVTEETSSDLMREVGKMMKPKNLIPYDLIGNGGAFRSNPKPEPTKPARKRVKRKRKIA